jgi:putative transposase
LPRDINSADPWGPAATEHAAKKFFRKLLKGCQYDPRVVITDKLKSYGAAKREILPGVG